MVLFLWGRGLNSSQRSLVSKKAVNRWTSAAWWFVQYAFCVVLGYRLLGLPVKESHIQ